jgi:ATP-dependent DNA helicase DinG
MDRIRRIPGLDLDRAGLDTIEELSARLFDSFRGAGRAEFYLEEVAHGEAKTRIEEIAAQTCASISRLQNDLLEKAEHDEGLRERIEGMARLCGTAREDLDRLVFGAADNCIRWGAASNPARFGRAEPRVSLHITPISVAPTMQQCFWDRMENEGGVVMLSATLANSGGFSFVRSRLGVPETATECIVGSPFDYRKQAMLYVPGHLAPPAKGPTDVGPIADEIERILALTSGRAFLLFTSWSVLNGVYDLLRLRLPFPLFKQGDQPPARLVDEFRTSGNGCLFGVQTFWEGVDVPGDALSCVIIDRIPFAVPDSPTTKARIQAIEAAGGDSFREFSIPQAQIRLKQGFGRLVRSRADRGIVCILDTRLISRG